MTDTDAIVSAATGLRRVLATDKFDDFDWADAQTEMPKLSAVAETLAASNWTAPAVLGDVFASLHKGRPTLHEVDEIARTHRVNRSVMGELMGDPSWRELREYTVGDTFGAGLAVATMADQLGGLYDRLAPAQEAADTAERAAQDLAEATKSFGGLPGASDEAQAALGRLREAAADAAQAADEALDDVSPSIGRAVRLAAGEAAAEAADAADAAAGWGLSPGEMSRTDPAARRELAELISTDRMRRIAELVGRMRNMIWGEQSIRFDQGPDEVHDVILSNDLRHITSAELVNMAVPELTDMFWMRYATKSLLCYDLRSTRRDAKGGIVYVEDSSLSMEGERELNARATGIALLDIAIRQNRKFTAIVFSGPGSFTIYDFDLATRDTAKMLDYASLTIGGGTEFTGPLDAAVASLDADRAATGRADGDIVFATDGECEVSDKWLAAFDASRARLGFTCYGLNIGGEAGGTLERICDGRVAEIHRLIDGDDARDIFRSINTDTRS